MILKTSGLAAICIHKEKVSSIFKVTSVIDDPHDEVIIKVVKIIKADIAKKKHKFSTYSSLKKDTLNENSSDTLSYLLSQISPKLKDSLVTILINHMVTSAAANTFSMLQMALVLLVNSKRVVETLHEFGIILTYHEVRRLKISATAAVDKNRLSLNMNASDDLLQVIADNFDATINSQNGMKQTHALPSIFTQANCSDEDNNEFKFPRLKKSKVWLLETFP